MKTKISARKFLSKYMIYLAFVALLIVFSLTLRNVGNGFLDMGNVWNIIRQTALIAILGVGMTYALGAGQIDLSVGSVVGLTSLVTAWTVQAAGLIPGVLAGLAVGAVVGALNGALIAWVKIPPFIATLGTQILFAGVSRTVSGLKSVPITNMTFNFVFGGGDFGGVPVLLLWMVVIVVVGQLFLRKRPFGRQVISVGGNPKAALYSGVRVKLTIFKVMLLSGVLASLAGILWAGRFGGGRYSLGEAEETSAIASDRSGRHEHQRRQGLRGGRLRRRRHARHDQQRARHVWSGCLSADGRPRPHHPRRRCLHCQRGEGRLSGRSLCWISLESAIQTST